jgi:hypothetical protein
LSFPRLKKKSNRKILPVGFGGALVLEQTGAAADCAIEV